MNIFSKFSIPILAAFFFFFSIYSCTNADPYSIKGELKTWHTITISFRGPAVSELAIPNPFLDLRLNVDFIHGSDTITVPGFYAADGRAAESGAGEGNIWQVRFKPDREGPWKFSASFREGENLAISDDPDAGTPLAFDGTSGQFSISPSDKTGRDFRAHGRLEYSGERYLRFSGSGEYFLKGGADSPENFLAYHDFDGTRYGGDNTIRNGEDVPNAGLHGYTAHIRDWQDGDPLWQGDKGKGIIGAINYLASKGMNSVYFLTMNVQGDGDDVWPWTGRDERYRFDCSRLDQWEMVFDHMEKNGIMMHIVLQETENECLLDSGRLDIQRKLYLRELIARFAHHLAVTWNIGEENGPVKWSPVGQSIEDRKAMMSYIRETDPYSSFIAVHTHSADPDHTALIEPFLGFDDLDGPSLQLRNPSMVHEYTSKWISLSRSAGRPWVVCLDEIGPHWMGVIPDRDDPSHDTIRQEVLWGNLMAGGAGVEWYFGYNYDHSDLNCEDWRSRDLMWDQTRYALDFFNEYLPFPDMESHDEFVDEGLCLARPGHIYAIYLPKGGTTILTLPDSDTRYTVDWYDPRKGGPLVRGNLSILEGKRATGIGAPPDHSERDWVCLVRKL